MTNEERLSLVERCKTIAAWREKYGDNANVMLPALEAKQIAEIALASLQAESFAFIHPQMLEDLKYKTRSCGRCWTGSHDELSGEARIPVYTTAPAMPDGFDPDSGHETTVVAHYHAHGEWIKCKSHIEEICDYVLLPELKNVRGL
ncbi:hypothetical protein LU604_14790 [Erwinia tracheiphila]|uniref:DUF551 domain-containing protein n=1 Tax=Erwinia tracheiphila TaxID=65700 RepID=A0A345CQ06_9GAMM|nr:hypothetical protein [Erwinia tracheiphila]AXF75523.1 hypothetical protein AV903_04430 [Erwinia tracheiphila]UIA81933.1 hypothetical protein LU604_14790 [Erwinia tracheiphila]UIA90529.1 hypothetical protein LU632_14365 [Erwinia tracheiphila]